MAAGGTIEIMEKEVVRRVAVSSIAWLAVGGSRTPSIANPSAPKLVISKKLGAITKRHHLSELGHKDEMFHSLGRIDGMQVRVPHEKKERKCVVELSSLAAESSPTLNPHIDECFASLRWKLRRCVRICVRVLEKVVMSVKCRLNQPGFAGPTKCWVEHEGRQTLMFAQVRENLVCSRSQRVDRNRITVVEPHF